MTENVDGNPLTGNTSGERTITDAFELLQSSRRRDTLAYLRDSPDGATPLSELAAAVLEAERTRNVTGSYRPTERDVYTDLYHTHVPRLDDAGVVAFDESTDEVHMERLPEPVEEILSLARDYEGITWGE